MLKLGRYQPRKIQSSHLKCGETCQIHEGGLWLADEAYTCSWLRSLIGPLSWILTPHWLGLKPAHCTSFTRENWFRQGWTTTSRMILASSFLLPSPLLAYFPDFQGQKYRFRPHTNKKTRVTLDNNLARFWQRGATRKLKTAVISNLVSKITTVPYKSIAVCLPVNWAKVKTRIAEMTNLFQQDVGRC